MKREPPGLAHVFEACERLQRKGTAVTLTTLRSELLKWRGVGVRREAMVQVLGEWRRRRLVAVGGRVKAAVDALLQLTDDLERGAVRAMFSKHTAGGVKITFTVRARNTGGGHRKRLANAALQANTGIANKNKKV